MHVGLIRLLLHVRSNRMPNRRRPRFRDWREGKETRQQEVSNSAIAAEWISRLSEFGDCQPPVGKGVICKPQLRQRGFTLCSGTATLRGTTIGPWMKKNPVWSRRSLFQPRFLKTCHHPCIQTAVVGITMMTITTSKVAGYMCSRPFIPCQLEMDQRSTPWRDQCKGDEQYFLREQC